MSWSSVKKERCLEQVGAWMWMRFSELIVDEVGGFIDSHAE